MTDSAVPFNIILAMMDLGVSTADNALTLACPTSIDILKMVGAVASNQKLQDVAEVAVFAVGRIGARAATSGLHDSVARAVDSLKEVGVACAVNSLGDAAKQSATALRNIGVAALESADAYPKCEPAVIRVLGALAEVGVSVSSHGFSEISCSISDYLQEQGVRGFKCGLVDVAHSSLSALHDLVKASYQHENVVKSIAWAIGRLANSIVEDGLKGRARLLAGRSIGILRGLRDMAVGNEQWEAVEQIGSSLGYMFQGFARQKDEKLARDAYESLWEIGKKGLDDSQWDVVEKVTKGIGFGAQACTQGQLTEIVMLACDALKEIGTRASASDQWHIVKAAAEHLGYIAEHATGKAEIMQKAFESLKSFSGHIVS